MKTPDLPKSFNSRYSLDLESKILLVRHGESLFNMEMKNLGENPKIEERNNVKFSIKNIDSDLTKKGYEQSFQAGERLKNENIKCIFVSPLIRALRTCTNILSKLPIKPKVIVCPYIVEKLEDNCDFLLDIEKNKENFPTFDWTQCDEIENKKFYQFNFCDNYVDNGVLCKTNTDLSLKGTDNYYIQMIKENLSRDQNYNISDFIVKELNKLDKFDVWVESSQSHFERVKFVNKFLNNYAEKLVNDEKILVVGHSILFKHMTLVNYIEEDFQTKDFCYLGNCQIASYKLQLNELS